MRVTLLSKAAVVGAYQKKFEEMAAAAPDLELSVIAPNAWRQGGQEQPIEYAHKQGYDLIAAPIALNGRFHTHFYPTLGRILRQTRPDLLHMDEEPYNLATAHGMSLARRCGAESVFFTWQNLDRRYPPPFRWLERYCYARARMAICGNEDAARVLTAKGFEGRTEVIPQFGVDAERFSPPTTKHERPFTMGYAGRLVPEKGLDVLLHALIHMQGEWRLRIIGAGPELARLEQFVVTHRLTTRVTFVSPVPSDHMPEQYHRLDALVLPSLTRPNWKEQFGRVLIEAMACGVPVVGSDSGEIPHVIGCAGLTFPEGDSKALQERLERLRDDTSLHHDLSIRGHQRVRDHYTQRCIAERTVAVYRDILSGSGENRG